MLGMEQWASDDGRVGVLTTRPLAHSPTKKDLRQKEIAQENDQ